jgi:hypothetical protein
MAENRLARELETRSRTERPKRWVQPTALPEPDKQPGYSYRWIRVTLDGKSDERNISSKFREGWEPVKLEEQPQYKMMVDVGTKLTDQVRIGELLLCKMPQEFVEQRAAHFDKVARDNMDAVDNNLMRESDPRMPLFKERKSSTSFGKGI